MKRIKPITIYLAGPFFNETQVATIRKLENLLESKGFSVYSPSRDGEKLDLSTDSPELRTRVFESNVENLTKCDIIVAVIDDRDTGTMWEMGCRYGAWVYGYDRNYEGHEDHARKDVPAIITYTDHDYGVNLMLTESIMCHCKGTDELSAYLDKVAVEGIDQIKRDLASTARVQVI